MALRMLDFRCDSCGHEFEELVRNAVDGRVESERCPECAGVALMIEDVDKRTHRQGNKYRHVSWSTWSIG